MTDDDDQRDGRRATAELTISALQADDLSRLEALWRSLLDHIRVPESVVPIVAHHESWPRRRRAYEELLADGESFALGARRGTALIGYAMVHVAEPDPVWSTGSRYVELTSLSVAPDERARGVGTALLEAVERELAARGIDGYVIGVDSVNERAQAFYERRGFRIGYHLMYGRIGATNDTAPAPASSQAVRVADAGDLVAGGDPHEIRDVGSSEDRRTESPETAAHGEG